jgi:hypothetical protein
VLIGIGIPPTPDIAGAVVARTRRQQSRQRQLAALTIYLLPTLLVAVWRLVGFRQFQAAKIS